VQGDVVTDGGVTGHDVNRDMLLELAKSRDTLLRVVVYKDIIGLRSLYSFPIITCKYSTSSHFSFLTDKQSIVLHSVNTKFVYILLLH
jgi:hypothetical protein